MKKNTVVIVALLACAGIILVYGVIGALLGWKNGGGILPLLILGAILTSTWKGIMGLKKEIKSDSKTENLKLENEKL